MVQNSLSPLIMYEIDEQVRVYIQKILLKLKGYTRNVLRSWSSIQIREKGYNQSIPLN